MLEKKQNPKVRMIKYFFSENNLPIFCFQSNGQPMFVEPTGNQASGVGLEEDLASSV